MTRWKFIAALLGISTLPALAESKDIINQSPMHTHLWVKGPFYLMVANSMEEPDYYPPSGMVKLEFCKICGIVRVPLDHPEACADKSNLRQCAEEK